MTDKKLLEKVSKLGFPMLEVEETFDVKKTLAEVVGTHDMRLWEGFPVLVGTAVEKYQLKPEEAVSYLKNENDRKALHQLLLLVLALFKLFSVENVWTKLWPKQLSEREARLVDKMRSQLANDQSVKVDDKVFSAERLKMNFENYFKRRAVASKETLLKTKELFLEYALSQVFSPKQKELFYKKLNNEKMTKTEREYYSRAVKRKAQALASDELHELARKTLE